MTSPCQADWPGGPSQRGRGVKGEARLRVPHAPAPAASSTSWTVEIGAAAGHEDTEPDEGEEYILYPIHILYHASYEQGCPHQPPLAPRRSSQYCRRPCMQRTGCGT